MADLISRLVGFAVHDDDCAINRAARDTCSCGLSLVLQEARHRRSASPLQPASDHIVDADDMVADTAIPTPQEREAGRNETELALAKQFAASIANLGFPVGMGIAPPKEMCLTAARSILALYTRPDFFAENAKNNAAGSFGGFRPARINNAAINGVSFRPDQSEALPEHLCEWRLITETQDVTMNRMAEALRIAREALGEIAAAIPTPERTQYPKSFKGGFDTASTWSGNVAKQALTRLSAVGGE